jgi:hypothetical protein
MKPHLPAVIGAAVLGPAVIPVVGFLYACDKANRWQAERAMRAANPDHPDYAPDKKLNGKVYPR